MAGPNTTKYPRVLEYISRRPGEMVWVQEIEDALNLTRPQVQSAMGKILSEGQFQIDVLTRGNCWAFKGVKKIDTPIVRRVFEEIGPTNDGSIIIQDSDGKLYRANEI